MAGVNANFVSYIRVSTGRQGQSGLGVEAQRDIVSRYVAGLPVISEARITAEFLEVESGKRSDRPQLAAALALCRATSAILIVAKLDRLARDVDFLRKCVRDCGDAGILFCDLPDLPPGAAGRLMLTVMSAIAEFEAGRIGEQTKAALQAAKARGIRLGNPHLKPGDAAGTAIARVARSKKARDRAIGLLMFIDHARAAGANTLQEVADALMCLGVRTPNGKTVWHAGTVRNVEMTARGTLMANRIVAPDFSAASAPYRNRQQDQGLLSLA